MRKREFECKTRLRHIRLPIDYDRKLFLLQALIGKNNTAGVVAVCIDLGLKILSEKTDEQRIAFINSFR